MPTLRFETIVPAPLDRVWAYHEDVHRALPELSPPESRVRLVSADVPVRVGSRVVARARGPLGIPVRMVARIVEHLPPHDAPGGGRAARFVDEQESGPFAAWRHEHVFEWVDDASTRMIDRVIYRALGPIGRLADRLVIRRQLESMFRHRHGVLHRLFG